MSSSYRRTSHASRRATVPVAAAARAAVEPLEKRALLSGTLLPSAVQPVGVNTAPTTSGIPDVAVLEDAPDSPVSLWDAFNDAEQSDPSLTYTVTANTNPGLFTSTNYTPSTGILLLDYAPDANGTASLTVRATDTGGLSVEDTFVVTVTPVNDAPSFVKGPDQSVLEDSGPQTVSGWATAVSPGAANESGQVVTFLVTTDNPSLFAGTPAVAPNGTLSFTPSANASGTATLTVRLKDDAGTADGGQDTSAAQTFTITVGPVDDAPTLNRIANRVVLKDAAPQTVVLTGVSPGPGEDFADTVTLTAVSSNPSVVPDPTITGSGSVRSLSFQPVAGQTGNAVITVTARDSQDNSFVRTFTVRVVNEIEEPVAEQPESPVNTYTASTQQTGPGRAVASAPDGSYVVTWASFGQGDDDGFGVYAQRFDAGGVKRGPEFRVNQTKLDFQNSPDVAVDAAGNFVITWQSLVDGPQLWDVYARRYDRDGNPLGGEFLVNNTLAGSQTLPSVAVDADGDFVVAWSSNGQDGSSEGVYARRFDELGAPQGPEFRVNTFTTGSQSFPAVASDGAGNFAVAWQSEGQDGSGSGVYAQQYTAAGTPLGGEVRMNETVSGSQRWPSLAPSAGGFVVAWTGVQQDSPTDNGNIYVRRLDPSGPAEGGETLVNTTTSSTQFHPSVASDADGDFVVAWEDPLGTSWEAYAQRFDSQAFALGGEMQVNSVNLPTSAAPYNLDVAMDAIGDIVATWTSFDGSGSGVVARRFTLPSGLDAVSAEFVYQSLPHRLRVGFNQNVSGSLQPGDLVVVDRATGAEIRPITVTYESDTNTAVFAFNGALPNGDYRATIAADAVRNGSGNAMVEDFTFNFFSLAGDIDRNRAVNTNDFIILASNFGKTDMTYDKGDLNGDGRVDSGDFIILASNFGRTLPTTPSVVSAASVTVQSSAALATPTTAPKVARKKANPPARKAAAGVSRAATRPHRRAVR